MNEWLRKIFIDFYNGFSHRVANSLQVQWFLHGFFKTGLKALVLHTLGGQSVKFHMIYKGFWKHSEKVSVKPMVFSLTEVYLLRVLMLHQRGGDTEQSLTVRRPRGPAPWAEGWLST